MFLRREKNIPTNLAGRTRPALMFTVSVVVLPGVPAAHSVSFFSLVSNGGKRDARLCCPLAGIGPEISPELVVGS